MKRQVKFFLIVFVFMFLILMVDETFACTSWSETVLIPSGLTTMCYNVTTIVDSSNDGIIKLDANDIILDCNGSIIGGSTSTYGIFQTASSLSNVTIKNCTFYNYNIGVYFGSGSINSLAIINSNFSNNNLNLYLTKINNSNIENIIIGGSNNDGIWLANSYNVSIVNSTISQSTTNGIKIENSKNITIYNNTITQNTASGIYLSGTTDSWIDDNDIVDNGDTTFALMHLENSPNNNITMNLIKRPQPSYKSNNFGIKLLSSSNDVEIKNNIIDNMDDTAVWIDSSTNAFLFNNTIMSAGINSILLQNNAANSDIIQNNITSSGSYAIKITSSASNIIDGNTILNSNMYGVYVDNTLVSPSNMTNNLIKGAGTAGIYLIDTSDPTKIYNNTITNTSSKILGHGISISGDARYNNISYNDVSYTTNNGLYFSNYPRNNQIYYNFLRNSIQDDLKIEAIASATNNNISLNALTKNFTYPTGSENTIEGNIIANLIVDNDTNPIRDYSNITDAVGAADAGNKIFVYDGYYEESVNLTKENMTLVGETKEGAFVNCSNGDYAFKADANNVTVDNFTISCNGTGMSWGISFLINGTNHTSIVNTIIKNSKYGVVFGSYGFYNTITRVLFDIISGTGISTDGSNFLLYTNITENNFSSNNQDIDMSEATFNNSLWKNNFTSKNNVFQDETNFYCINGWDNWYNGSLSTNPECFANFTAEWNDSTIYVNDTVRLIVNLTGETEIAQLNATIYANYTASNYSLSYLNGNNITGQWYLNFTNTSYEWEYHADIIYRLDADGDYGVYGLPATPILITRILGMNTSLDKTNENINQPINIYANVTSNASVIENVTAYILKPDGYLDIKELQLTRCGSEVAYCYSLKYENTTRSGEYDINITVYAKNTITENKQFTINYGWPYIKLIEGNPRYENNTNHTRRYNVIAINGDLANVTAMLYINNTVIDFNNDVASKNTSHVYMGTTNAWEVGWNITTVNIGDSYVNLTIANSTILSPNGYYNDQNTTVNISAGGSDTEDPIIENLWIENNYTTYNLNETATIYANISDNFGVKSAFLNITHPTGFSENIAGDRVETYQDNVVKFKFNAENITTLTTATPYIFYTNASDYSDNTNISTTKNFNTTGQYSVDITIYDIYNRGEWVNVSLDVKNINNLSVSGFSQNINLTDTGLNTTTLPDGTYFITTTNKTGIYSIYANVSKHENLGNATKEFNITDKLIATITTPTPTFEPTPKQSLTILFRISNARGEAYPSTANFTGYCYITDTGVWDKNNETEGTYIGEDILWANDVCYAPTTFSTLFNITFNISDNAYNNTGIDTHFWTTNSESTTPSGGDDTSTTSPSIGGNFPMPITTEKENIMDFDFSIKPETLTIMQGKKERTFLVIDNTGDTVIDLDITIKKECCEIDTNSSATIKPKNKISVPLDIYANLTTTPNEYHITITAEKGTLKETETLIAVVEENPAVGSLRNLKEQADSLKQTISQYKTAGVDTKNLEKRYETLTNILIKAQTAINNDDLETLKAEIAAAKIEKAKLEAEILGLKTILWLNEYKEELIAGIFSSLIIFLFTTKFLIPYIWMKKELMHLRKKERELAEVRKATEIQYFKRQIDEATFNKIMADKQSAINDTKIEIRDLETSISLLKRGKFSKIEGIEKYKVSGKLKQNMGGFTALLKKQFAKKEKHIQRKKSEEFSFTPKESSTLKDPAISPKGPIAKITKKYHNWKIKKQERKLVQEIGSLETEETKLENEESKIKKEIDALKKEKEEIENS